MTPAAGARVLDVSELPPPEPLDRILTALADLRHGEYLRVLHRREPWPLFPMLEQAGYAYRMRPHAPPGFEILIWPSDDASAAARATGEPATRD